MRGFARLSAAVPASGVADFERNTTNTLALWRQADADGSALVVFPELGLSGYSTRDLLHDTHLLETSKACLLELASAGRDLVPVAIVGLPLRVGSGLYNVAAAIHGGRVLAVVPKAYLPNYREFEETRWFRPGVEVPAGSTVQLGGEDVPFGMDVLLHAANQPDLIIGIEVCEDYWVQIPPSAYQVGAGATVIANLSASNFIVGKAELRRTLACASADRGKCAYIYVAAGPGESSTDVTFDADAAIVENGRVMVESERFSRKNQVVSVDIDLEALVHDRLVTNSFGDCARENRREFRRVAFNATPRGTDLLRDVTEHPFLPSNPQTLARRTWEIFEIQVNALATRISAIGIKELVLGVSGGLDSTQAALVAAAALDTLELPRSNLLCVTMPGLGTSTGTRTHAEVLAKSLGASFIEVGVSDASHLVLTAVDHPAANGADDVAALIENIRANPGVGDVALENVQARLRTLVLMTLANWRGGLVVGTGDLSEKALGWSTYAGDHIAMYDVNAGVPKTLIQFVVRWVANERVATWTDGDAETLRRTLFAILDTPISPELLPPGADGKIAQLTEDTIGPYELHDFYLYHLVRHGARPARILDVAQVAFSNRYTTDEHKRWLTVFLRRFFNNQFKRSCTADGPKVGMVALSPRGDWRMPSDAQVRSWLAEVERYPLSQESLAS
ncbi:MAG: NAD(+) synthase [Chromatiales bacterium]|jgi:NAD+ synthase (glutamine-hydrolysing)|nr:NAD(+) synthase [Chromatiales bacterium]